MPKVAKCASSQTGSDEPNAKRVRCSALTVAEFRLRLEKQGKFFDTKPGTNSKDGCLHDPPRLPPTVNVISDKKGLEPVRDEDGCFVFPDHPNFRPNLSPKEVLHLGSFGGTYFRDIVSAVTGERHNGLKVVSELPKDWLDGLDLDKMACNPSYSKHVNKYKVSCGGSLAQWESSGWITDLDPYGWFQWYCRFFQGRRTTDDERQVQRWCAGQGPTGRWRNRLLNDIIKKKAKLDDVKVSPVIRQVLQHWAYKVTGADLEAQRSK
eukprot:TRINITY_DN64927_c0_g1_i1.p1 TRINITY_DN64927_c0_g1~~TRINITY_DN64927_c0_g1_i1.p1  ORF type:complete len:265 (-),score=44.19 TRINITY_DN64927_c0_g1_i1:570-1364(-)